MDRATFENKLKELASEFGASQPRCEKPGDSTKPQSANPKISGKEDFDYLEDSLDFLRVCIKYMRFDLDATRRENQYLRKLFDDLDD
jgi:hypothetical protein